uniref:Uncharacterized protein n=1 Tax=Scophthalmus maximus TaxID=52904 RepID=A0A8D3AC07_SCOMX
LISLCYSSDRQLSLDLVNVGRQRLDFLPMLEHSGTYQETAVHTGTFAQEIITLVHHVKEHYFRDDGLTLNERFSAAQRGSVSEEEVAELTLDERFSSNRYGLNQPPVRGPGDLRHDLERRRQERLEGVKVTIAGKGIAQRPLGPIRCNYTSPLLETEIRIYSINQSRWDLSPRPLPLSLLTGPNW